LKHNTLISIVSLPALVLLSFALAELGKRKPYDLHLPFISTTFKANGEIDEVFVSYENSDEGWAVSPGDDRYVKDNRKTRVDHTYKENPRQAYLISPFEAELINRVAENMKGAVAVFEKDLKGEKWDRILYLDAYLPEFLKNFYYLFCAARSSFSALPSVTAIADSLLYDRNAEPEKSDLRVQKWRANSDKIMKLRISAKEVTFQIEQWQQKELDNPKRDLWEDNSKKFADVYELFIRLYFNLPPM